MKRLIRAFIKGDIVLIDFILASNLALLFALLFSFFFEPFQETHFLVIPCVISGYGCYCCQKLKQFLENKKESFHIIDKDKLMVDKFEWILNNSYQEILNSYRKSCLLIGLFITPIVSLLFIITLILINKLTLAVPQVLLNICFSFSLYLLIANSFSLIYYPIKFFHLAHAAIITSGAYLTFLFANQLAFPFPIAIAFSILAATFLGILCELVVYRNMRKKNVPSLAYLITSIGLYVVLQNCISLFFGDDTKIINTAEVTVGNQIFGAYITTIQIITIFVSIALFIAANLFLHYTATGKSIRAVASNPELCNIYGISSNKIILIAFGIGSALAATAGILSAMDTNMTPTFGFNLLLYGVVAMIIGGVGSTRGLIAGALLVATAQHLAAYYIDTKWMDAVTYIILILFLIWKPLGFSGKRLKKVEV